MTTKKVNLHEWDFLPQLRADQMLSLAQLTDIHTKFINTYVSSVKAEKQGLTVLVSPEAFQYLLETLTECWTVLLRQYVDQIIPGLHFEVDVNDDPKNTLVEFICPQTAEELSEVERKALGLSTPPKAEKPAATPLTTPTKTKLN